MSNVFLPTSPPPTASGHHLAMKGSMHRTMILIFLIPIFLGIFSLKAISTNAQPEFFDQPRPDDLLTEERKHPRSAYSIAYSGSASRIPSATNLDFFYFVYQGWSQGNWEIFFTSVGGSMPSNISSNPSFDGDPSMRRGDYWIAFVSDRDGDEEIYTMAANGYGLEQLTFNDTTDWNPIWSRDGKRIAFTSERDGQPEIYVMDADGSNQTRLTYDPEYDGEPAWSPDGSQIAFTSYRTGGYRIWVMNADGSDLFQLSDQPYSENPSWSPDGSQIAYDSDGDQDGFQELWLMNAEGSDQRMIYKHNQSSTDTWMGCWSPDGRSLLFTLVYWEEYQGEWYWTDAYVYSIELQKLYDPVGLTWLGVEAYPDMQVSDGSAPTSSVLPLPRFSRNPVAILWPGNDGYDKGVLLYDVQTKESDANDWEDWQNSTTQTSASFTGTAGKSYDFRSRAVDQYFNAELWPAGDGDAHTTLYSWGISGRVMDTAGYPVVNAILTTTPGAFTSEFSDYQGEYRAYIAPVSSSYNASWEKPGYATLPDSQFPGYVDVERNIYLTPIDNVLNDEHFEDGGLGSVWLPGGEITPVLAVDEVYSGLSALQLGQPGQAGEFSIPQNLSNSSFESGEPALARCADGSAHFVWVENGGISYSNRSADGSMAGVKKNISAALAGRSPQIGCDRNGGLHVVWLSSTTAYYTNKPLDGDWSTPRKISADLEVDFPPQLAVQADGTLHVMWGAHGVYYTRRDLDGFWSLPVDLPIEITQLQGGIDDIQIIVAKDGSLHALFWARDWYGKYNVFFASSNTIGYWRVEQLNDLYTEAFNPQLIVGADGIVHATWIQNHSVPIYRRREVNGEWSISYYIGPGAIDAPYLAAEPDGAAHAIWAMSNGVYYAKFNPGGEWSTGELIPAMSSYSDMYLDMERDGTLNLLWVDGSINFIQRHPDGSWSDRVDVSQMPVSTDSVAAVTSSEIHSVWAYSGEVYYSGPGLIGSSSESKVMQTTEVTSDLHKPGLSLLYKLKGVASGGGNRFSISIGEGITNTVIYQTDTPAPDWTHLWVDVSQWSGKSVTLTMSIEQENETYPVVALLDEISLGSWLTPVVHSLSPIALEGNQPVEITISGLNFIDPVTVSIREVSADSVDFIGENMLVAHFNQGISPGLHALVVTNPGGQDGIFPVQVGKLVYIPLVGK